LSVAVVEVDSVIVTSSTTVFKEDDVDFNEYEPRDALMLPVVIVVVIAGL
jgi:hypothetical protein